jgi:hypothetical protein
MSQLLLKGKCSDHFLDMFYSTGYDPLMGYWLELDNGLAKTSSHDEKQTFFQQFPAMARLKSLI